MRIKPLNDLGEEDNIGALEEEDMDADIFWFCSLFRKSRPRVFVVVVVLVSHRA